MINLQFPPPKMPMTRGMDKGETPKKLTKPQVKKQLEKLQVEKPLINNKKKKLTKGQE